VAAPAMLCDWAPPTPPAFAVMPIYADTVRQAKEQYDRAARERKQEEHGEVASRKVDQRRRMLETMLARLQAGEASANRKRVADEANSASRPRIGPKSNEAEKSSPAADKLDRILEKLEQLERRLDRLERDRPQQR
jgi:hypothetical protein